MKVCTTYQICVTIVYETNENHNYKIQTYLLLDFEAISDPS